MKAFLITVYIIYILLLMVVILTKCIKSLEKKSEEETGTTTPLKMQILKVLPMGKKTKYSKKAEKTVSKVMKEWGGSERPSTLHSGSKKGPLVESQKQAEAIGISEAKRKGERVPKKK